MRRLCAVVAAVALASCGTGGDARPTPARLDLSDDLELLDVSGHPDGAVSCGDFELSWTRPDPETDRSARLTVRDEDDRVVAFVAPHDTTETLDALRCGDLTGDEDVELVVETNTNADDCCTNVRVDTLGGPTLLTAGVGHAQGAEPEQLGDGDALELVTESDALAFLYHLPFDEPPYLPRVFALRDDRYVDATKDFPAYVREGLREAERDLARAVEDGGDPEDLRWRSARVFGHHVILGTEDEGLEAAVESVDAETEEWIREHAGTMSRQIRTSAAYR